MLSTLSNSFTEAGPARDGGRGPRRPRDQCKTSNLFQACTVRYILFLVQKPSGQKVEEHPVTFIISESQMIWSRLVPNREIEAVTMSVLMKPHHGVKRKRDAFKSHDESSTSVAGRPKTSTKPSQHSSHEVHGTTNSHKAAQLNHIQSPRTNQPSSKAAQALPIWPHAATIRTSLTNADVLIISGETGSGKSTLVPQFLLTAPWREKRIAVTQPRRVAAINLARRVASELGTPMGRAGPAAQVGYSVRFDDNVGRNNSIKFLTEGMLLQEMLRDPQLDEYDVVIVDEVHERSVNVDLILGFLKSLATTTQTKRQKKKAKRLKVVIMSATADVQALKTFFEAALDQESEHDSSCKVSTLFVQGRQHPVETIYLSQPTDDFVDAALKCIFQVHCKEPMPGDVLVFLTGQETIQSLEKNVQEYARSLSDEYPKVSPTTILRHDRV